ncbi:putative DNA binding protein [Corchorus olitorius]|uniref:DNA binding protein n=1 Tax=Corchorus olitorius TaxID=93759 RepID=A0A1R3KQX3_9ROSI|nr:putative DNA binding protein [Corchorus olitorius]
MTMTLSRNNIGINLPAATPTSTSSAKPNNPIPTNPSKQCGNCGAHSGYFLHQVRLLGILRRLCTSCVLRLHPSSFCPACFDYYNGSPPQHPNRIACSNCSSLAHSHCAGGTFLSSYLCPPCKDSSFSFFPLKDNKIDKNLALPLLCAAKISAASMEKAANVARAEAVKKAQDAALAKKRAREALEHLLYVTIRENARNKENENAKVEDMDLDNGDGDGDIDVDLVRHIEDSLAKDEPID